MGPGLRLEGPRGAKHLEWRWRSLKHPATSMPPGQRQGEGAGRWVRGTHRCPGPGCVHAHSPCQLPQLPWASRVRPLQGEIYHGQVCFKTVYYPGL